MSGDYPRFTFDPLKRYSGVLMQQAGCSSTRTGTRKSIGCALLEFGEILDRFHGALRAEQPLDVHAAERRRIDPMAIGLRTDIADKMRRAVGVAVRMTIEAGDATARFLGTPIFGLVELLLRERRHQ